MSSWLVLSLVEVDVSSFFSRGDVLTCPTLTFAQTAVDLLLAPLPSRSVLSCLHVASAHS